VFPVAFKRISDAVPHILGPGPLGSNPFGRIAELCAEPGPKIRRNRSTCHAAHGVHKYIVIYIT